MKKIPHEEIAPVGTLSVRTLESRQEVMFGRKREAHHRQFLLRKIAWRIPAPA